MFNDSFKMRYTSLPIAVSERNWDEPLSEKAATFCHNHREVELVLVEKGRGLLHLGSATRPISSGDVFFVSPYDLHYTEVEKGDVYCSRCICFDPRLLGDAAFVNALEGGTKRLPAVVHQNETVKMHITKAYEAAAGKEEGSFSEAAGHLFLLFAYLRKNGLVEAASPGKDAVFCKGVLAFLNENYEKDISSADIARALYTSQGHFCRRFRQTFGESFSLYLRRYRLERAREMLSDASIPVSGAAFSCGFSDAAYFTKSFRETFGVSPRMYRNNKNGTAT